MELHFLPKKKEQNARTIFEDDDDDDDDADADADDDDNDDTTTSERILTLESIMRHCVVSPAAVNRGKSSWGSRGSSRALT